MPPSNLAHTRVSPPKLLMPSTEVTRLRLLNSIASPGESASRKPKLSSKISSADLGSFKRSAPPAGRRPCGGLTICRQNLAECCNLDTTFGSPPKYRESRPTDFVAAEAVSTKNPDNGRLR